MSLFSCWSSACQLLSRNISDIFQHIIYIKEQTTFLHLVFPSGVIAGARVTKTALAVWLLSKAKEAVIIPV